MPRNDAISVAVGRPRIMPIKEGSSLMNAEYDVIFTRNREKWRVQRSVRDFNKLQSTIKPLLKKIGLDVFKVENKVKKNQADKIFTRKRSVLENWLKQLCGAELQKQSPEFAKFIGQKEEDNDNAQSPDPSAGGEYASPPSKREEQALELEETKQEIERLKAHSRKQTLDLESAMEAFAEMEEKSKQLEEEHQKTLEQMRKQQDEHAEINSLFKSNKDKQHESSKRVYELESTANKLTAENKQLFKVNADLQAEVVKKEDKIQRLESKIETLQISQRKVEREKTDLEIARIELQRKLEHQRLLKMDEDNVERVVAELERENAMLREAQLLSQLFVKEDDPILVTMTEKIKELELTIERLLVDKKQTVDELLKGKKEELLRVTTELTGDLAGAAQTEILVLRKELLVKESELKDKEIEFVQQRKEVESNVFKKFKEKLTHIRSESSRRFDTLRLEVAKLTSSSHQQGHAGGTEEESTDREVLRLRRILLDKENSEQKIRLEMESQEKQFETEIFHLTGENESLRELALSKKDGDSAMMGMMKQQLSDLSDEIKAKSRELEEERKLREKEKIAADTNYKTLQIDFDDLQKASTKKLEKLKLDLQKKELDLSHIQLDGLHGVEDMEELYRKNRALRAELRELKQQNIINRGSSYLNLSLQRIQAENDRLKESVLDLRNSKIRLITTLSLEMDNMRSELKYHINGRRGDPPRYYQRQQNENSINGHEKRNTIDKTLGVASDAKYDDVYEDITWERLRTPNEKPPPRPTVDDL